jgi:prepilin-type N-terminal cleavage/methylation domain-containing protein
MRRLIADERGVSLVEMLVVIVISGLIMGVTLTTFTQFEQTTAANQRQNEGQEQARRGLAGVVRELRNLASPTDELPEAVVRKDVDDLVFQSVTTLAPRRVRYCLNPTQRRLWRQVQLAPFSDPSTTACPDPAWGASRVNVENVTNGARAVFSYNSTDRLAVTEIGATLWVDVDLTAKPTETALQSSVFLRNQNRKPVAVFTPPAVNGGTIVLNGSQSSDPEGKALDYFWYDSAVTTNKCVPKPPAGLPQTGCVAQGIVASYTPGGPGIYNLYLIVRDAATLTDQTTTQPACVPGLGVEC